MDRDAWQRSFKIFLYHIQKHDLYRVRRIAMVEGPPSSLPVQVRPARRPPFDRLNTQLDAVSHHTACLKACKASIAGVILHRCLEVVLPEADAPKLQIRANVLRGRLRLNNFAPCYLPFEQPREPSQLP